MCLVETLCQLLKARLSNQICSLRVAIFKSGIVEQVERFKVGLGTVIEENGRTTLPLELGKDKLFTAWHSEDFKLDLGGLIDGFECLLLFFFIIVVLTWSVDLLLALEVEFPRGVRYLELLVSDLHLLSQSREDLLRRHRREETVCAVSRVLPVLQSQQDRVWIILVSFGQLWVLHQLVDFGAKDEVTAHLGVAFRLHGLLLLLFGLYDGLVGLVTLGELGTDLLSSGELTVL